MREKLQTLVERIMEISVNSHWSEFAAAWIDGRLARGAFIDYCTGQPATPDIFVFDCKVASTTAASDLHAYLAARMREDAACAIKYFEAGDTAKAESFASKAASAFRQMTAKTAR